MALIIRLRQQGCKNNQTFRLVLIEKKAPRGGRYLEKLGVYSPLLEEKGLDMNPERISYWISQGACLSERAKSLIKRFAPEVIKAQDEKKRQKRLKVNAKKKKKKTA